MKLASLVALVSSLSLAACATAPVDDEEPGMAADGLTEARYARAVTYLRSLTYLPWSYTKDGCYARALYYTANLAAEGIAANHVYIVAKPGYGLGATGEWRYHVAPLVSRDATNRLLVLDPVYASTPLPLSTWYDRQSAFEGTPHAPVLKVAPGTSYGDQSGAVVPDPANADTATFREPVSVDAMPSFAVRDLGDACEVMHRYIDREDAPTKGKKHHDLSRDTKRLVTALADRGKLAGRPSALPASCTAYAPELEGCPADARATSPGSEACCLASAFWCYVGGKCQPPGTKIGGGICGEGGNFMKR